MKTSRAVFIIAFAIVVAAGISITSAWTAAPASPPSGNVANLITTGTTAQSIGGDLSVMGNMNVGTSNTLSKLYIQSGSTANTGSEAAAHGLTITTGTNAQSLWMGYDGTADIGYINAAKSGSIRPVVLQSRGGNVGVGTTNPAWTLDVNGDGHINGWLRTEGSSGWYSQTHGGGWYMSDTTWLRSYSNKGIYTGGIIRADGGFQAANGVAGASGTVGGCYYGSFTGGILTSAYYNCGDDLAEHLNVQGEMPQRGDIVAFGTETTSVEQTISNPDEGESTSTPFLFIAADMVKATAADRDRLFGVVPTKPGKILDEPTGLDRPQLFTLAGRVPVRMTLDGGDIAIGDPITISTSTPGAGMKAVTSGRIIGYAMAPFTAKDRPASGMIQVLLHIDEWTAPGDTYSKSDFEALKKEVEELRTSRH